VICWTRFPSTDELRASFFPARGFSFRGRPKRTPLPLDALSRALVRSRIGVPGRILQFYTLRPIPSRDSLGEKHWYQQHVPTISGKQLLRKTTSENTCRSRFSPPAAERGKSLKINHQCCEHPFLRVYFYINLPSTLRQIVYSSALAVLMAVVLLATRIAVAADSEVDHIVQILGLRSDSRVADVGAGSAEKSVAIASRVPRGIVYSTEVDPQLIDKIRNNVRKAHASNVIVITGRADDTQLPADCCDGIFLREVYHHLTNPAAMDRSLYRSVRPDGRLADGQLRLASSIA
jgi:protein-L-isoaspartate O-methyltransferase